MSLLNFEDLCKMVADSCYSYVPHALSGTVKRHSASLSTADVFIVDSSSLTNLNSKLLRLQLAQEGKDMEVFISWLKTIQSFILVFQLWKILSRWDELL